MENILSFEEQVNKIVSEYCKEKLSNLIEDALIMYLECELPKEYKNKALNNYFKPQEKRFIKISMSIDSGGITINFFYKGIKIQPVNLPEVKEGENEPSQLMFIKAALEQKTAKPNMIKYK